MDLRRRLELLRRRRVLRRRRIVRQLVAAAVLLAALPAAALDVPPLTGRVVDLAGLLSAPAASALTAKLEADEKATGRQVAVLIVPSLQGEVLENYSLKVARTWKLGRKGANDGVLLLVAKQDRKLRIEVGRGLEGSLPDALAGRIIADEVVPRFKSGDFEGGVSAGVGAILSAAAGTYAPPAPAPPWKKLFDGSFIDNAKVSLGLLFFLWCALVLEFKGILEQDFLGSYFALIPIWGFIVGMPFGGTAAGCFVLAHVIGFPVVRFIIPRTRWGKNLKVTKKAVYYRGSKLFSTSSGGGSGGGGSSGGGDWGGGGGDFGGGGSSGSW